jgi:hypothetical protein
MRQSGLVSIPQFSPNYRALVHHLNLGIVIGGYIKFFMIVQVEQSLSSSFATRFNILIEPNRRLTRNRTEFLYRSDLCIPISLKLLFHVCLHLRYHHSTEFWLHGWLLSFHGVSSGLLFAPESLSHLSFLNVLWQRLNSL